MPLQRDISTVYKNIFYNTWNRHNLVLDVHFLFDKSPSYVGASATVWSLVSKELLSSSDMLGSQPPERPSSSIQQTTPIMGVLHLSYKIILINYVKVVEFLFL